MIDKSTLKFGDNLNVMAELLEKYGSQGIIDLCYIDPPFNSKRQYNMYLQSDSDSKKTAQNMAFDDTWSTDYSDVLSQLETLEQKKGFNYGVHPIIKALADADFLPRPHITYMTYMAIRIIYIHKLLKDTGSFYLHCDPVMSHYLKVVCDKVFGRNGFRNEIVWERDKGAKGSQHKSRRYGSSTDTILFYSKSSNYIFEIDRAMNDLSEDEILAKYNLQDEYGRYTRGPIERSKSMGDRPNLCYTYKGYTNKYPSGWRMTKEKLIQLDEKGDLGWTKNGVPYRKLRPESGSKISISNLWKDIDRLGTSDERLGYDTQKPIALLDRIILASSNEGDVVADFFCGCGTTVASAIKNKRKFIGCDISAMSIKLISSRIKSQNNFSDFLLSGIPSSVQDAREYFIAKDNLFNGIEIERERRDEFEGYVIELLLGGVVSKRKSRQGKSHDGYFSLLINNVKYTCYVECKSGKFTGDYLGDFANDIKVWRDTKDHHKTIGLLVAFEEFIKNFDNTKDRKYREDSGIVYVDNMQLPLLQIISIEDLIAGVKPVGLQFGTNFTFGDGDKNDMQMTIEEE